MGTRFVILVVIALLIVPWASFPTSSASDARSSEDVSVNLTKEVWGSNEAFFANILAENLVLGQGYLIDWAIRTGNGSQGSDFTVRNGQINFTATTTSSQQNVLAYHLNSKPKWYSHSAAFVEKSFDDFIETIGKDGFIIVNGECSHGISFTLENSKICMSGSK